jgi:hypothetical protein
MPYLPAENRAGVKANSFNVVLTPIFFVLTPIFYGIASPKAHCITCENGLLRQWRKPRAKVIDLIILRMLLSGRYLRKFNYKDVSVVYN